MPDRMNFDALEDFAHQLEALPEPQKARWRAWNGWSPFALLVAVGACAVGTASAAGVISGLPFNSDGSVRPEDQAALQRRLAPERKATTQPHPAPAAVGTRFTAFADGTRHDAASLDGIKVWANGTQRGACIHFMRRTDLGPGGNCYRAEELLSGIGWGTSSGLLMVPIPDAASELRVRRPDGTTAEARAVNNVLVTRAGNRYSYRLSNQVVEGPRKGN